MAHLEVERKPKRPWWVWLLIILLLIALAVLIFNRYNSNGEKSATDSISNAKLNTRTLNFGKYEVNNPDLKMPFRVQEILFITKN
ncbi:hypothetical protein [Pedobacter jejuensis]|uniref:Uncharacterized protein n=1 Tax=Pedobacter jejuensis TaxID=1268550 RepID=A0A3N0BXZ8_9SPHI|nr:hypothetical protein [Pedobacter jejuensis]RNL54590.1 hypothetical protein D7004_07320 [Pedobacter jejuensis]